MRATGSAGGLHCELKIGDSMVMIGGGPSFDTHPVSVHLYVSDTDEVYARAIAAGATSLVEPSDIEYGERFAAVKDIGGNEWYIEKRSESPIEDLHSVAVYFHPLGAPKFIDFVEKAFGATVVVRHQSDEGFVYTRKCGSVIRSLNSARHTINGNRCARQSTCTLKMWTRLINKR